MNEIYVYLELTHDLRECDEICHNTPILLAVHIASKLVTTEFSPKLQDWVKEAPGWKTENHNFLM